MNWVKGPDHRDVYTRRIPRRLGGCSSSPPRLRPGPAPAYLDSAPGPALPVDPASSASPSAPWVPCTLKMAAVAGRLLRTSVSGWRRGTGAETLWWLRERASQMGSRSPAALGPFTLLGVYRRVTDQRPPPLRKAPCACAEPPFPPPTLLVVPCPNPFRSRSWVPGPLST